MSYNRLKGLTPKDFQHPGEKVAMAVMRNIPLMDKVFAKYVDMSVAMSRYAETQAGDFRITEKTNPRIYKLYKQALDRLDITEEYPLYSHLDYTYNACADGAEKHYIVLNSSTIADYTDEEMLYLLGHELGHIKCGHMLYQNLAKYLNVVLSSMGGVATAASIGLSYALMDWSRKAEYSADRAGLIAVGSVEGAIKGVMKLMDGSNNISFLDITADKVMNQIGDFEDEISDVIGKVLYVAKTMERTHPWSILRLKQLDQWGNSGEYDALVARLGR